jgi:hypothetical protein
MPIGKIPNNRFQIPGVSNEARVHVEFGICFLEFHLIKNRSTYRETVQFGVILYQPSGIIRRSFSEGGYGKQKIYE